MEPAHQPYSLFPILECGVDWLTCTAPCGRAGNRLYEFAAEQISKENAAGGAASAAIRLGFSGHRSKHVFVGRNPTHVMFQASGLRCSPLATEAITLATNVSRMDLQVTVWTEGEQPHLGLWTYRRLCERGEAARHNSRLTMIQGQPDGETLYVGRRVSEWYGRLYDKTAELGLEQPRLIWRYELELKGKAALRQARKLVASGGHPSSASKPVHEWYTKKGVQPAFAEPSTATALEPWLEGPTKNVLSWFSDSVSKTYAKAVLQFGRTAVHAALGIPNDTDGG